jgi:hypothetical protein
LSIGFERKNSKPILNLERKLDASSNLLGLWPIKRDNGSGHIDGPEYTYHHRIHVTVCGWILSV